MQFKKKIHHEINSKVQHHSIKFFNISLIINIETTKWLGPGK